MCYKNPPQTFLQGLRRLNLQDARRVLLLHGAHVPDTFLCCFRDFINVKNIFESNLKGIFVKPTTQLKLQGNSSFFQPYARPSINI